jgi:hypothetical protein
MRKIYYVFIGIFLILIVLELTFTPSKTPFAPASETHSTQAANMVPVHDLTPKTNSEANSVWDEVNVSQADTITWKMLGVIKYVKKPHPEYKEGVMFPVINATVKAKGKKRVILSGFIIPVDPTTYALSKNVFASCFFCGQAGPETITGIKFRGKTPKLKTDQYVTLEGVFRYNDSDVDDWIYHIEDAIIVKGN